MQASYGIGSFLLPLGIKDKPFKGEFEQITSKNLPTGGIIQSSLRIKVYRAANGSTRFENFEKKKDGDKIYAISIYNHNEQKIYFLELDSKSFYAIPASNPANQLVSESESPIYSGQKIGRKVIEGFVCYGYRVKRGKNDVYEYWISEDLDQTMLAKSIIENETNTLRLFDIERLESESKMFIVPKDYKLMKLD